MMQKGRGGMGMKKHGTSGKAGYSPRFRHLREIELQREVRKRPRSKLRATSVKELLK